METLRRCALVLWLITIACGNKSTPTAPEVIPPEPDPDPIIGSRCRYVGTPVPSTLYFVFHEDGTYAYFQIINEELQFIHKELERMNSEQRRMNTTNA